MGATGSRAAGSFSDDLNLGFIQTTVCLCYALMGGMEWSVKVFAFQGVFEKRWQPAVVSWLCQNPVSICERFTGYTFREWRAKRGRCGSKWLGSTCSNASPPRAPPHVPIYASICLMFPMNTISLTGDFISILPNSQWSGISEVHWCCIWRELWGLFLFLGDQFFNKTQCLESHKRDKGATCIIFPSLLNKIILSPLFSAFHNNHCFIELMHKHGKKFKIFGT